MRGPRTTVALIWLLSIPRRLFTVVFHACFLDNTCWPSVIETMIIVLHTAMFDGNLIADKGERRERAERAGEGGGPRTQAHP